ncbi:hypothetical protein ACHAW6_002548 [Cyclotella cf. meneghiniana]
MGYWYIDASFAVHPSLSGYTGGGLTVGRGFPITASTNQKLNTRSSTKNLSPPGMKWEVLKQYKNKAYQYLLCFVTDQVNMNEVNIHWCPTKEMVADFWTKPLQGNHFKKVRDYIMGRVQCVKPKADGVTMGKSGEKRIAKKGKLRGTKGCTKSLAQ